MRVKQQLHQSLHRLGLDVRRYRGDPSGAIRQRFFDQYAVDLVIDAGANRGQYGRGVRQAGYRGRLVSFEPTSEARRLLVSEASGDPSWQVASFALGSIDGPSHINVAANGAESSSLLPMLPTHSRAAPGANYIGIEAVEVRRLEGLSDVVGPARRIHLKMDVQGYEGEILDGAEGIADRIVGVEMEISFVPLYEGGLMYQEAFARMTQSGYALKQLFPGFTDSRTGDLLQAEAIFYREASTSR